MPTERELLATCLRWIEDSPEQAFDRAMLIDAIKGKLKPELEIHRLRSFLSRLIDPEDLGHAVTAEVRQKVSALLKSS
jgi:hypothetical protein